MKEIFIIGEAGRSLDDTRRVFNTVASSGTVRYASQTSDILDIAISPRFYGASAGILPEVGQKITLELGSERIFEGVVTAIPTSIGGEGMKINITASGPWWWLENTPITEVIAEAERPQFACPKGDLRTNLIGILNRAIAQGLPIRIGEIPDCYDAPTVTFQGGSYADAVAELIRLIPDAGIWWDYSGTGNPSFNLTRRNAEAAESYRIGIDPIESLDITPEWALKVSQVSVPFASRDSDGAISYQSQEAVQDGQGLRQVAPISGPELVDFVPPDPISSQVITSVDPFTGGGSLVASAFTNNWPLWREITSIHDGDTPPTMTPFNPAVPSAAHYSEGIVPKYYDDDGKEITVGTPKRFLARNTDLSVLPQWLIDEFGLIKGHLKGTWYFEKTYPAGVLVWDSMTELDKELRQAGVEYRQVNNDPIEVTVWLDVNIPVYFMEEAVTSKTYYQPLAYEYEQPPADFAANLREAQNWLPYSGSIQFQRQDDFPRLAGKTINIEGGLPSWNNMGALIQGESFDLFSKKHDVEIGVPGRLSGTTPVHRINRSASDVIVLK